ncbi:Peptidoglycan hydrolase FlgJ [Buchnera aphidicola (Tetraneura ulmi)]|uniref:rod-binding protein n=1 Tax=Buchnera aphidicola TaxID=9 RepID=UPI003464C2FA
MTRNFLLPIKNTTEYNNYTKNRLNIFEKKINVGTNKNLEIGKMIEGLFIQMILKISFPEKSNEESLFNSDQERMYTEIYHGAISQIISNKGIGLASMIEKQLTMSKKINV